LQKSQESFVKLIDIIGGPKFVPDDVRATKWSSVNTTIGDLCIEDSERASVRKRAWKADDGWRCSTIRIEVPFHHRMDRPGTELICVGEFYHRSLVSIIKEKLTNSSDIKQFHYQPYRLFWKPQPSAPEEQVHGELYTSKAFLDSYSELQKAPGEPGCDLERVIVALMVWSDATQLTSFGSAKIWPCYVFFGNESKYRRAKPTCNLCEHLGYFQSVCFIQSKQLYFYLRFTSCQATSRKQLFIVLGAMVPVKT
jgi:hypothetical protein